MIKDLISLLGPQNILTAAEDILPYSFDGTATLKQRPQAVVFPTNATENRPMPSPSFTHRCVLLLSAALAASSVVVASTTAAPLTLSLNGTMWQFRDATKDSDRSPAVVPGCVHLDLLRNKQIPDPFWGTNELDLQWIEEHDWEYRHTFDVSPSLLAQEVIEFLEGRALDRGAGHVHCYDRCIK
jgi:hypothetical protein